MLHFSQNRPQSSVTFSHFNRKGWSLFACLGREVRIVALSVATLGTATPRLAAQTVRHAEGKDLAGTIEDVVLDEATAVASRTPLAADVAARQVVTLRRDDLAAAGITSINDILKLCAGVDVRQRGGFGVQTDVSIDGGTFDQITIMVNGVAITNPQTGHNAADFPVNLQDILAIEVLEGGASRVLGTQAFAGAINIVTRGTQLSDKGCPWDADLRLAGGSYGTVTTEGRAGWQTTLAPGHRFGTSLSGSYRRSDGAVTNGDFDGGKAFWQGTYTAPRLRLEAQFGITGQDFGANTFYSGAYPNQWEATRRYLTSLRGEWSGRIHITPQVSWMRNYDHYQLTRGTTAGENFNRTDVLTLGVGAWTKWALGRTALGVEWRRESLYSRNLGRPIDESEWISVPGQEGLKYNKHDGRHNLSLYAEHNVVLRDWTLSAGVMAVRNDAVDHSFRWYPGIDIAYRPGTHWRLYLSAGSAMRLPTFTDLYYKSPTQEGNVGLRPERSTNVRLGAAFSHKGLRADIRAFYNHGTDMIDWVMRSAEDKYHAANFQLDTYGIGATVVTDFESLVGKTSWFKRLRIDYTWLTQNRRDDQPYFKSNYAMEYLRHKFVVTLDHRIVSRLGASWTLRVQEREGAFLEYNNAVSTGVLKPYGTHAGLDLKLHWSHPHYSLFVEGSNLTGHRYYDLANVLQPGTTFVAGVSLRL